MLLSKCAVCEKKKKIFIKEQKFNGLLIGSGIKTSLDKTPIFGIK